MARLSTATRHKVVILHQQGYLMQTMVDCEYSDSSMTDMVLSWRYVFNKKEVVHYDSKIQKYIGNTACGVKTAETWNKDKAGLAGLLGDVDRYCKGSAELDLSFTTDRKIPPTVRVRSVKPFSSQHQTMLVCYAFGFYPREIKVTWRRNGAKVTADVSSSELLHDGDWTYQIHLYLELTPQSGDSYTCRVEHSTLAEAIEEKWDPAMPESERNKIIIGASAIILGLVIAAAGLIYYKKKATESAQVENQHKWKISTSGESAQVENQHKWRISTSGESAQVENQYKWRISTSGESAQVENQHMYRFSFPALFAEKSKYSSGVAPIQALGPHCIHGYHA
ncbi:UNVERIFIED_CONTAM: hypothetical protein FKN15_048390 [Acipenser sinensis]